MTHFSQEQVADLNAKLDAKHVKQRSQAGRSLSYVEGWHAIAEANRIFGHDGWCSYTDDLRQLGEPREIDGKWRVAWMAKVRIVVGPVVREGVGYGSGIDRDLGSAHESAVKEAETDARKRGLMTFGWPFGLALYDKAQEHVDKDPPARSAAPPAEPPAASSQRPDTPAVPTQSVMGWLFVDCAGGIERINSGSGWFTRAEAELKRHPRDATRIWGVNGKTGREIVDAVAADPAKHKAAEARYDQIVDLVAELSIPVNA